MTSFDQLLDKLISQIDIDVVFAVQAITAIVRSALNFWSKTRQIYTDWMMPFIAVLAGTLIAFGRNGASWESVLHGLVLGGGAVFFQTLFDKGTAGFKVLTGRSKDDPLIQAKAQKSASDADQQISKMKSLLGNRKKEVPQ